MESVGGPPTDECWGGRSGRPPVSGPALQAPGGWLGPAGRWKIRGQTFCLPPAPLVCAEWLHLLALLRRAFLPGPVGHEDPDSL